MYYTTAIPNNTEAIGMSFGTSEIGKSHTVPVFFSGCQEIRIRVETPQVNKGTVDIQITQPEVEPTPRPEPTIKPTAMSDETTILYGDSNNADMFVSVYDDVSVGDVSGLA